MVTILSFASANMALLDSEAKSSLAVRTFSSTAISSDASAKAVSSAAKVALADNITIQSNMTETARYFALIFSPQLNVLN